MTFYLVRYTRPTSDAIETVRELAVVIFASERQSNGALQGLSSKQTKRAIDTHTERPPIRIRTHARTRQTVASVFLLSHSTPAPERERLPWRHLLRKRALIHMTLRVYRLHPASRVIYIQALTQARYVFCESCARTRSIDAVPAYVCMYRAHPRELLVISMKSRYYFVLWA